MLKCHGQTGNQEVKTSVSPLASDDVQLGKVCTHTLMSLRGVKIKQDRQIKLHAENVMDRQET